MSSPSQSPFTFAAKTNTQIRDDILRTIRSGLLALGVTNPNTGPSSDYYLLATALGNELAVPQANAVILADQLMPDTCGGTILDRWLALFELARNGATNSFGNVTITISTFSTQVVTGALLVDNAGLPFVVTVGGTYGNGAQIPVQSVSGGAATNHANGDTLTWVTAPPFAAPNVTVGVPGGSDGLEGGADSEEGIDEPPRSRLFAVMQQPRRGGNWADLIAWAQQSTPDVQAAFAYPALLGASTAGFVVVGAPQTSAPLESNSKTRELPQTLIEGTVLPYVLTKFPEHALAVGASAVDQPVDLAIFLALPPPPSTPMTPPLGFIDASPWPSSANQTQVTSVTAFATSTQFTVNAPTPPIVGVSHISWLSPLNWQLYSATVLAFTGTAGAYVITIDTPMPGIRPGNFVFPTSANQATYVEALLSSFATMGPGEWLPPGSGGLGRAFRHPMPSLTWPSALGATQLSAIIRSGSEVEDAQWIYRSATSPTVPSTITVDASGNLTSPAPSVLVPRNIAFMGS